MAANTSQKKEALILKYAAAPLSIPAEKRAEINQKLLTLIRQDNLQGLTHDEVFQAYTGLGGLHGLKRNDYANRHAYSVAKRELELGQFFTPAATTQQIVDLLEVESGSIIMDLAVGSGAFINPVAGATLNSEHTFYGCDIDLDALTIARFLYPEAKLQHASFAYYQPGVLADVVLGNPPFLLPITVEGTEWRSELLFLHRAAQLLKPGGLLAIVAPANFLTDEFHEQTSISALNENYRFLTRYALPDNTFDASISTSVIILQRSSPHLPDSPWQTTSLENPDLERIRTQVIRPAKELARGARAKIMLDITRDNNADHEIIQRIERDLHHIKSNPRLAAEASRIRGLLDRALHETRPEGMSQDRWEKHRVTLKMVSDESRRILKNQHLTPRDETRVVLTNRGLKLKAYSPESEAALPEEREWSFADLISNHAFAPPMVLSAPEYRAVRRRATRHEQHSTHLANLEPDPAVVAGLRSDVLYKPTPAGPSAYSLTQSQAEDLARLLTRDYAFIAWAMGGGKTSVGYKWARAKAHAKSITVILAPAIAIHQTWEAFLQANNHPHRVITSRKDALSVKPGETILVSLTRLPNLATPLKRALRQNSYRVTLLVDESDELSNFNTRQTQAALSTFARAQHKLLMTGTITRNAIRESYAQLHLLYNSSSLFTSEAPSIYRADRKTGDLEAHPNPQYGEPYQHARGYKNYTESYNPTRASVFGIDKQVQDIYNFECLTNLMQRTIIRRSFTEIVGPDRYSIHQHPITMSTPEQALHEKLVRDFHEFLNYFQSTGNTRKDAGLRAVRQLRLLIESCLHAHLFPDYAGTGVSSKFEHTKNLISAFPKEHRTLLGVQRRQAFGIDYLEHWQQHLSSLERPVNIIHGGLSFDERQRVIAEHHATPGSILLATMDSLRSSVSLRDTQNVVMPGLSWNLPRINQFAFRAVRFDNNSPTRLHFITYQSSIEQNLWNLLVNKELGNIAVSEGRVPTQAEIAGHLQISPDALHSLLAKTRDYDGKVTMNWTSNLQPAETT